MNDPTQVRKGQEAGRRKRKVSLWLVLLIGAALGIALAFLIPTTSAPPM